MAPSPEWQQLYLSRAKLKAVSRTSALLAGFAMVAMVEVQLSVESNFDPVLLILFSIVTTLLIAVHLFALMISTCLLPNIEAASSISVHDITAMKMSPHKRMRRFIEVAWILSIGVGLILFLIEIALLIWLKFVPLDKNNLESQSPIADNGTSATNSYPHGTTEQPMRVGFISAVVATCLLVPICLVFAYFACHFYKTLAQQRCEMVKDRFQELMQLDNSSTGHLTPNPEHMPIHRMLSTNSDMSQRGGTLAPPYPERRYSSRSDMSQFSCEHV